MSYAYRMPSIDEYLRMQRIIDYLNDRGDRDSNEGQMPRMSRKRTMPEQPKRTLKPRIRAYEEDEYEEEEEMPKRRRGMSSMQQRKRRSMPTSEEETNDEEEEQSSRKRRRTHLMDHLNPREQKLVHEYYHNIGQKGGRHRGYVEEESGYNPRVREGYLKSTPREEQKAVSKFLHAVQVKKNVGEREAEQELDEEYTEEESEDESENEQEQEEQRSRRPTRRSSRSQRRTHLMDHLSPHEQELVHHYYHEIGQKGGRHRGAFNEEFGYDRNVKRGYLSSAPQDEQKAVHKFLHAVQVKKNVGEREAEEELDEEYSDDDENYSQQQQRQQSKPRKSTSQTQQKQKSGGTKQQQSRQKKGEQKLSDEQKKLLKEGRRGRKLEGRSYNVRDLKIDEAEKTLSQEQQTGETRGQKRKKKTLVAPTQEEEVEEDEEYEEEEEQEEEESQEEGEEEEEEETPRKKPRSDLPQTDILSKMSGKEQEAVLRYFDEVSQMESKKMMEGHLKSKPKEEQKAVQKFLDSLNAKQKQETEQEGKKQKTKGQSVTKSTRQTRQAAKNAETAQKEEEEETDQSQAKKSSPKKRTTAAATKSSKESPQKPKSTPKKAIKPQKGDVPIDQAFEQVDKKPEGSIGNLESAQNKPYQTSQDRTSENREGSEAKRPVEA